MWWPFGRKGESEFSWYSTAEEVTHGINGTGLTAIVTGSSSGIGAETARVLALRGVHIVMGVNILDEGIQVKHQILKQIPNAKVDVMELDLSSMSSVRKFATEFKSSGHPLNILINNAGIFGAPFTLSEDNIELHFAVNYLGHFLLTHLLIDKMRATVDESGREGRIVNISSMGHHRGYSEGIRFDEINNPLGYSSWCAYSQSKLAVILHAAELTKRLQDEGIEITVNSLHPGMVGTNIHVVWFKGWIKVIIAKLTKYIRSFLIITMVKSIPQGAATTCYLALHPGVKGISGKYFVDCKLEKPSSLAQDPTLAKKLWQFSINLVGE